MSVFGSYLEGRWVKGQSTSPLADPTTGEPYGAISNDPLPLASALPWARKTGGEALRAMTFRERAEMLDAMAKIIHAHRDDLIEISRRSHGTTRGDAKFDIDGAAGTLAYYAELGRSMGDRKVVLDGEPEPILRSKRFAGQHVFSPRRGLAVHINAFNFPAWGMAEKAAVALLAGVPVLTKPATSTCALAVRIVELWLEPGEGKTSPLPPGALSLLVGPARDLLDHLGPQDCLAFTGGSETAASIRGHKNVVANNVRVNIEADSLNASILGPDVEVGSDTFLMFIGDVARDMLQKAGQKCTAVRRIFVPADRAAEVTEALVDRLSRAVVGDPAEKGTDVGPLASASQQQTVRRGIAALQEGCQLLWQAKAPDSGCFVPPSLFRSDKGKAAPFVHEHEVFGPVATVLTWPGPASDVVEMVAAGGGGLVASVYSDDEAWASDVLLGIAPWHGRLHWGSKKVHDQSPGPGTVLPNLVHGGPGKAGGGEELGGPRGLQFYWQRTAIQGDRALLERILSR